MAAKVTRRAALALFLGSGAAALAGCRAARAGTVAEPATPPTHEPTATSVGRIAPGTRRTSAAPGRTRAETAGRTVVALPVDSVERRYVRYEPATLDPAVPVPLVLVLHGRGGSGAIAERLYEMNALADAHGFVVAYPDALGDPPTWHSGLGMGGGQNDDVRFARALVAREAATRPIDPRRTFVCGHSSGAMMSYRLAAEASDLFPAVGVVAGAAAAQLPHGRQLWPQQPAHPVSVIHLHGTTDELVPYGGGTRRGTGAFVSAADSIAFWVAANGCDRTPTTETVGAARRDTYSGGRDGAEVTLWTLDGAGHAWPKTRAALQPAARAIAPAADISASDRIWAFFAAHPRGTVAS